MFTRIISDIKFVISIIYRLFFTIVFYHLKVKNNKVIFCNFHGQGYSNNSKYVCEKILDKNVEIIWVSNFSKDEFPKNVRVVKYGSIAAMYEYSTAKVWVDDSRASIYPFKKKGQYFLQLWHAPSALKKVEADAEDKLNINYVRFSKIEGKITDAIIVADNFEKEYMKKYFWLNDNVEFLEFGMPRNDLLFSKFNDISYKKYLKDKYHIGNNDFIILYMPTFRDYDYSDDEYIFDFNIIVQNLTKLLNKNVKVFIKLHPNDREKYSRFVCNEKIINQNNCCDVNDLYLISDILISDYSTSMFDFYIVNKKILLYINKIENYIKYRGLSEIFYLINFQKCCSHNAVVNNICNMLSNYNYCNLPFINYSNGQSSLNAANWILSRLEN